MSILKRTKKTEETAAPVVEPTVKKRVSKKAAAATAPANAQARAAALRVVVRPLSTEKLARLGEGVYGFRVALTSTKVSIAQAVHALYGVRPVRVNVVNGLGKAVRYGRTEGRHADWKKAIVFLKKGEHIDVHAGV
jgi:large subunit ribosomal protein L23